MWYIFIVILILVLIYFKKKSKSKFFLQDDYALEMYRDAVKKLLQLKGRSCSEITEYLKAYDFFCRFTTKFDGATIVKDLCDIPGLDLDAMLHDYDYLTGANRNYIKKWKADLKYISNMEKNAKGVRIFRLFLLTFLLAPYVPYCALLTPKYYDNK